MSTETWSRIQFGFTITYHYLFPQLTIGLALLIVIFKSLALRKNAALYNDVARFWARIFALNFAVGVVTGLPMEFQFGTNWARFASFAGGVIGVTLAMEGMFAFFAESAFLGLFLFGEKRLSPRAHLASAIMLFLGSWSSGYFIVVSNAFMQQPAGYERGPDGALHLAHIWTYLFHPWAVWEFLHTMCAAVITAAFVVAAVGAGWTLLGRHREHARTCLRVGVIAAAIASALQLFPTGDQSGKLVAKYQHPALAAMEGKFQSSTHAELVLIGQPDVKERRLENPVVIPGMLSFLAYGSFGAKVDGLDAFPEDQWPDQVELVYYAYHVMVGLGTLFIAVSWIALLLLITERLERAAWMLWILMLSWPFPYIATTAGWATTELGRQPWVVYGLQRTTLATSPNVSNGDVVFTMLGWVGLYVVIGVTFLVLVGRELAHGPETEAF